VSIRAVIPFIAQVAAALVLRKTRPDLARPFRMWLYPLPALVALLLWVFVFLSPEKGFKAAGFAVLGAGVDKHLRQPLHVVDAADAHPGHELAARRDGCVHGHAFGAMHHHCQIAPRLGQERKHGLELRDGSEAREHSGPVPLVEIVELVGFGANAERIQDDVFPVVLQRCRRAPRAYEREVESHGCRAEDGRDARHSSTEAEALGSPYGIALRASAVTALP